MPTLILTAQALRREVANAADVQQTTPCSCALVACAGWESLSEDRWPGTQMRQVATLRDPGVDEPTFEEYHPEGTRYDAAEAPVAVAFFPYNRCDLWQCSACNSFVLRYTEFGGYYVDHRVRKLRPELIVDPFATT